MVCWGCDEPRRVVINVRPVAGFGQPLCRSRRLVAVFRGPRVGGCDSALPGSTQEARTEPIPRRSTGACHPPSASRRSLGDGNDSKSSFSTHHHLHHRFVCSRRPSCGDAANVSPLHPVPRRCGAPCTGSIIVIIITTDFVGLLFVRFVVRLDCSGCRDGSVQYEARADAARLPSVGKCGGGVGCRDHVGLLASSVAMKKMGGGWGRFAPLQRRTCIMLKIRILFLEYLLVNFVVKRCCCSKAKAS